MEIKSDIHSILKNIPHKILQHPQKELIITALTIDSRKAAPSGMFIAIKGLTSDGHKFINSAGAGTIVIDTEQETYPQCAAIIKVQDSRKALAQIAANFYGNPAEKLRLFGVTGTNGKTSTAIMLQSILNEQDDCGLIGTLGIMQGETVLDIPFDTSTTPDPIELHAVFERFRETGTKNISMEVSSHALALHKVKGLMFEAAMFTNLTQDHLDFHGTMENYLRAKAELFRQCRVGVVNIDDEYAHRFMEIGTPERWVTYGINRPCDLRAVDIKHGADGIRFRLEIGDAALGVPVATGCRGTPRAASPMAHTFFLPVKGEFNIYNALAAIGSALTAGLKPVDIAEGLARFKGVPGRIQSVPNNRGFNVFVDYAHTPDGLENIIRAVRRITYSGAEPGRIVTLFGCGGDRDKDKRPIMGEIAGRLSDYCIITSDNPRGERPEDIIAQTVAGTKRTPCEFSAITDRREAIFAGVSLLKPGDALIIAGKGHEDYQIIGGDTLRFDDFEVAAEALKTN